MNFLQRNPKHNQIPKAITVDEKPAYPPAVNELKNDRILPQNVSQIHWSSVKVRNVILAIDFINQLFGIAA